MPVRTLDAMMPETILRMVAATLVAPAAAPMSVFIAVAFRMGEPSMGLLAPLTFVTIGGIYGYAFAFLPVLLLGTALTALSLRFPALRPRRIWLATGAFFGILTALVLFASDWELLVYGAIAGSACALAYRLIVGPALGRRPARNPETGMEPR